MAGNSLSLGQFLGDALPVWPAFLVKSISRLHSTNIVTVDERTLGGGEGPAAQS